MTAAEGRQVLCEGTSLCTIFTTVWSFIPQLKSILLLMFLIILTIDVLCVSLCKLHDPIIDGETQLWNSIWSMRATNALQRTPEFGRGRWTALMDHLLAREARDERVPIAAIERCLASAPLEAFLVGQTLGQIFFNKTKYIDSQSPAGRGRPRTRAARLLV